MLLLTRSVDCDMQYVTHVVFARWDTGLHVVVVRGLFKQSAACRACIPKMLTRFIQHISSIGGTSVSIRSTFHSASTAVILTSGNCWRNYRGLTEFLVVRNLTRCGLNIYQRCFPYLRSVAQLTPRFEFP